MSFLAGIIGGSVIGGAAGSLGAPAFQLLNQPLNVQLRPTLPTAGELVNMLYKSIITKEQYFSIMAKLGYSDDNALKLMESLKSQLPVADIVNLKRRALIDDKQYKQLMYANGYDANSIETVEKASLAFPPVPDLVRFAVREAYTPAIVQKFQLLEDYPVEFDKEAQKAGLSADDAKNYWKAHWELPSIQLGFEMFQRNIISLDELQLLLRTQDVMPFWRDKVIEAATNPFTRVDVRRMYQLGVLDVEGVFRAYKDIGYNDERASKLTEFTVKDVQAEERDLTKAEVLKLYYYKEITRDKALEMLKGLTYTQENADMILVTEDLKNTSKDTTEAVKSLSEQFINYLIDDKQLREGLAHLNLKADSIDKAVRDAMAKRKKALKNIEKADIVKLLKAELIDHEEAIKRLMWLGYQEDDADLLLQLAETKGGDKE